MRIVIILLTVLTLSLSFQFPELFKKTEEIPYTPGKTLHEFTSEYETRQNEPEYLYNYAWTAAKEGKYLVADEMIEKAMELRPLNAFLRYAAGKIALMEGEKEAAKSYFERALENQYEYLDAWGELIKLDRAYNFNLAELYAEKAHLHNRADVADEAIRLYNVYLADFPDGEYVVNSQSGIRKMELLKNAIASQKRRKSEREERERKLQAMRMDRSQEKLLFRTTKPYIVGLAMTGVSSSAEVKFKIKSNAEKRPRKNYVSLTDEITLDDLTNNFGEFVLSGGYFKGAMLFRGNIHFGSASFRKVFLLDTVITTGGEEKQIFFEVVGFSTMRMSGEAIYNVYYADPFMVVAGVNADLGYISLDDSDQIFANKWIAGIGFEAGAMVKYESFIFEIGFKNGLVGSSKGTAYSFGAMYKF